MDQPGVLKGPVVTHCSCDGLPFPPKPLFPKRMNREIFFFLKKDHGLPFPSKLKKRNIQVDKTIYIYINCIQKSSALFDNKTLI